MATITITFDENFVKRHISTEIKNNEDENYICLYQKRTRYDGDDEEVYSLGLYKQVGGYTVKESGLNKILKFLRKFDNVQTDEA